MITAPTGAGWPPVGPTQPQDPGIPSVERTLRESGFSVAQYEAAKARYLEHLSKCQHAQSDFYCGSFDFVLLTYSPRCWLQYFEDGTTLKTPGEQIEDLLRGL